ncbi:peptide deformylase [Psittacicella gerlachiana]|uniref:Peptide deformylase n=1 Tax=Psittacicella gerlachiana TaxID=2028574 RepID=A0A3A1YI58_9GAMM|nr:peptide deformylase [Psittacicella gerlachiana]RIY37842.1 peptide deformylase [Psittacicella gerlachiana]
MTENSPETNQDIFDVEIYPEDVLRTRAQEYTETEFGEQLQLVGEKMLRTMYAYEGIGLAANQINLAKRIIVVDVTEDKSVQYIMINPEITHTEGHTAIEEGCLSAPNVRDYVDRAEKITCEYYDPQGQKHTLEADGLLAICIQHEIDHLNGIMFFDHLDSFKRNQAIDKVRKYKKKLQRGR